MSSGMLLGSNEEDEISELNVEPTSRSNHGRPWTTDAFSRLRALFEQGLDLEAIAETMGRTPGAICGQLERRNLVANFGGVYYRLEPSPWVDLRRRSAVRDGTKQ